MKAIEKILIVEDEAINALALRLLLTKSGFLVTKTVANGKEALEEVVNNQPDLILMDIRLAGNLDGIETARQIKKSIDIPIIFMTGYAETNIEKQARALNPLGFLTKPVNFNDIESLIKSINIMKS